MREVHARLTDWMHRLSMSVTLDPVGNLRGLYPGASESGSAAPRLIIGSHLDTVPHAGAFDGVLGVVLGVALVELADGRRFPFAIEVIGFSDEEGVRHGVPFIGSRALIGTVDEALLERRDPDGRSVRDAIRAYGLDPSRIADAGANRGTFGYLELHIEQGPVLDSLGLPLGIVHVIVGQCRLDVVFTGVPGHGGTTPMDKRRDALTGAAEWVGVVEREATATPGLVATVGRVAVEPGASNVVPGRCRATLDVRHADAAIRAGAVARLTARAQEIAARRGLTVAVDILVDQPAVAMDPRLAGLLERSVSKAGLPVHRMACGAGHDAMIVASRIPAALLLVRSPGGISHHPDETVLEGDVAAALTVARQFLDEIARSTPWST